MVAAALTRLRAMKTYERMRRKGVAALDRMCLRPVTKLLLLRLRDVCFLSGTDLCFADVLSEPSRIVDLDLLLLRSSCGASD